mmetsp:Transcript_12042/g.22833  ORF Transcript_12042/g.22833 Transcript_12042/m.22833 type:complete len:231 (-) Transcript_12042:491-1183(-)
MYTPVMQLSTMSTPNTQGTTTFSSQYSPPLACMSNPSRKGNTRNRYMRNVVVKTSHLMRREEVGSRLYQAGNSRTKSSPPEGSSNINLSSNCWSSPSPLLWHDCCSACSSIFSRTVPVPRMALREAVDHRSCIRLRPNSTFSELPSSCERLFAGLAIWEGEADSSWGETGAVPEEVRASADADVTGRLEATRIEALEMSTGRSEVDAERTRSPPAAHTRLLEEAMLFSVC